MPRLSSRRLAAVLLAAALTAACSSTVAGSAVTGSVAPSGALSSSAGPSSPSAAPPTTSPSRPTPSSSSPPSSSPPSPSPSGPSSAAADADGSDGTIGDVGIGDPYYPTSGNGGYQIDSYDIDLSYEPDTNDLQSTAQLDGTVLSDDGLTQFNLDLQPTLTVTDVTVNDAPATFTQDAAELVVTPAELVPSGASLAITVTYGGNPGLISGGTSGLSDGGWYRTKSGGAVVTGEPFSASAWYPVNEHPADTASFAVTATVPSGWKVMSNGVQQTDLPEPPAGQETFRWELSEPVASYLTTIYIDDFTVVNGKLADGTAGGVRHRRRREPRRDGSGRAQRVTSRSAVRATSGPTPSRPPAASSPGWTSASPWRRPRRPIVRRRPDRHLRDGRARTGPPVVRRRRHGASAGRTSA